MAKQKPEPKYYVYLTEEALESLKDSAISPFIEHRRIRCLSIQPDGYFLYMTASLDDDKYHNVFLVISIPVHYVLYILNEEKPQVRGFSIESLESDTAG
jgi:hypothetical protein